MLEVAKGVVRALHGVEQQGQAAHYKVHGAQASRAVDLGVVAVEDVGYRPDVGIVENPQAQRFSGLRDLFAYDFTE